MKKMKSDIQSFEGAGYRIFSASEKAWIVFSLMAVRFSIQFSSKSGKQIALIRKGFPNLDRSAPEETGKIGKVSCFRNGRGEASDFPFFKIGVWKIWVS